MILLNLFKTCFLKRDILVSFIKRDFYSKFAGSFLGMAWSYIIPAVQITTFYFIFGVMMGSRLNIQSDQGNYSTWLISGMLPWFYFSEIIYFGSNSLIRNSNLIKKTLFPSEILNISVIGSALINHLITIFLFLGFLVLSHKINVSTLPMLLFGIILLTFFSAGLSYLLSVFTLGLRDISHLIPILLNLAFFATPIVYSEGLVKDKGMIGFVVSNLNPVSFFVKIYRNALVGTEVVTQTELISVALISILVFYSGYYIFLKTKSFIVDML